MVDVVVVVGTGSLGQAIARRIGAGKKVLLADLWPDDVEAAAKTLGDVLIDGDTSATYWFGDTLQACAALFSNN